MAINSAFNMINSRDTQNMQESLIIEAIQQRGMDVNYLLREKVNDDPLFGEATVSNFTDKYTIEMYLLEINQFNGDGDLFGKFGLEFTDNAVFQVSVRRFKEELDGITANGQPIVRPREGDLIYLPLSDSLWEVKKVKNDPKYYQLGRNYTWRLVCNLFQFSYEQMPTDDLNTNAFNQLENVQVDSTGLLETLTINPAAEQSTEEQSSAIETVSQPNVVDTFDPNNPFGG